MSNSGEIEAQIRRWSSQVAIKEKRKPVKETKEKNPKSPAHPPYFQMIKEAIRALNKKEGSSPYAIAKYMENKHKPVLPANFRKILGLQLKNSVYKGTLIKIKASYKLSEGEITTTTTKVARANAAEPNEPIKKKLKTRAVSKICSPTSTTRSNARAGPRRTKRSAHAKPKEPKSIKSPVTKKASA